MISFTFGRLLVIIARIITKMRRKGKKWQAGEALTKTSRGFFIPEKYILTMKGIYVGHKIY
ncbi:hypothetical protein A3K34_03355 [candidate division WWE3 bacterium RIFOXYC1_FULL_40_10]|uniref:Uncharacterized protein n=1 Tax=candidate division WWE3 bacterium RIFOXYA2_FULL_46_9 TaxID=1802636 RepID=A0A1F4VYL5_UNCKA|nr:MAG: hypothetical protein A3K58_03355 [candidate division WWE3 bacterium RIFOXYB1_FULL_40_22]OGC61885.1 MAG: hypothetical protein A3K37_03355 [candidate division WWE3 bacterium RIFOXYA1_FULL_40_11]OGC62252.1 MAG: hypothetical protein A2264_03115 [candidate division WWE3 bacterium RIFOXYA2_FULL_46_9]OGC64357.1 MAG: hypothetical protein A2326_00770 [candidate division WWE3 bacterium RIFOXYB2_FULL_41_6]OGC66268.1 MAG: hypothetical protein A3K34_03355 [candidate division WWE3 bacterium RIFOXYC1_